MGGENDESEARVTIYKAALSPSRAFVARSGFPAMVNFRTNQAHEFWFIADLAGQIIDQVVAVPMYVR